jgi:hypothetical protein
MLLEFVLHVKIRIISFSISFNNAKSHEAASTKYRYLDLLHEKELTVMKICT